MQECKIISLSAFAKAVAAFLIMGLVSCKKDRPEKSDDHTPGPPPVVIIPSLAKVKSWLVDKNASDETASLFYNLKKLSAGNILFGQQDATKRGIINASTQWANEQHLPPVSREKSDVKEISGAYPAVYGHDFIHIANFEDGNWFEYEAEIARKLTIDAYNRGGVNTYAWHYSNPVSKGSFYWSDSPVKAVEHILPGGSQHQVFQNSLKTIADFAKTLIGADGKLIPVIFRPFHEMDGGWFWWGKGHCTPEQYKEIFRFTVRYLRDELEVRNFLYCWSPGGEYNTTTQYLQFYPGDDFVDIIGTDNYSLDNSTPILIISNKLKIVSDYAKQKNKIAAFTETGQQNLTISNWFTQKLLASLQAQKLEMAFVLVWANTKEAFWTPYKGHQAEADFIKFKQSSYVMFADEMPSVYKLSK